MFCHRYSSGACVAGNGGVRALPGNAASMTQERKQMARMNTQDKANLILSLLDALFHVAVGWHDRITYRLLFWFNVKWTRPCKKVRVSMVKSHLSLFPKQLALLPGVS